jgi:hypothetical protein
MRKTHAETGCVNSAFAEVDFSVIRYLTKFIKEGLAFVKFLKTQLQNRNRTRKQRVPTGLKKAFLLKTNL